MALPPPPSPQPPSPIWLRARLWKMSAMAVVSLLGVFVMAFMLWRQDALEIYQRYIEEQQGLFDRTERMLGRSLETMAWDYSWWSEMADFVLKPNPAWPEQNIDATLENPWEAQAIWVFDAQWNLVYAVDKLLSPERPEPPASREVLSRAGGGGGFGHFFVPHVDGIMEIRMAPIQHSHKGRQQSPVVGNLLVGRIWHERHLRQMGQMTGSQVQLIPLRPQEEVPATALSMMDGTFTFYRSYPGIDSRPAFMLRCDYDAPILRNIFQFSLILTVLFIGAALLLIATILRFIATRVSQPLDLLSSSLESDSPAPLGPLRGGQDEFARLARLVEQFFQQRDRLRDEIRERERTQTALSQSEGQLRQMLDDRSRLAMDLHDGVIQSLYAIGLQLNRMRSGLKQGENPSPDNVGQLNQSLDSVIREIRGYIGYLGSSGGRRSDLESALLASKQAAQHADAPEFSWEIPGEVQALLSPSQREQLAFMLQELVSNTVRHAEARHLRVRLFREGDEIVLNYEDDGCGWDPASIVPGNGLSNLRNRAMDLDARLETHTAPGQGVKFTLRLPLPEE